MTIGEMLRQGFLYARRCKSLWVFGFIVGAASGGSSGGGNGSGVNPGGGTGGLAGVAGLFNLSPAVTTLIVVAIVVCAAVALLVRFVSEGALIEGVVRARQGAPMTTREGFRAGWSHWGVLLRIGLLYLAATAASLVVLAAPGVLALRAIGAPGGLLLLLPALVIAVPWLVTLYLVQAFASRIAVLEHRRALDAIAKARLFLHGRLMHGLKLIVASFVGSLAIAALAVITILPAVLLAVAMIPVLRVFPVVVLACFVVLPVLFVLTAMLGTFRSSIWTIGYVTQAES